MPHLLFYLALKICLQDGLMVELCRSVDVRRSLGTRLGWTVRRARFRRVFQSRKQNERLLELRFEICFHGGGGSEFFHRKILVVEALCP